jgi:MarR family transcriptional repressor of mepA
MKDSAPHGSSSMDLFRWIGWAQMVAGQEWGRLRELSREQSFVLDFLVQSPGAIQRDIVQATRTTAASVSSLLQGLERRGLVERRTGDGDERSKRVYATATGADLVSGFEVAMTAANESILEPLTKAEQDVLHALLSKITAHLPRPSRP